MSYSSDLRELADIIGELGRVASQTPVPGMGSQTWADLLFDGGELSDIGEPSQALLHALAGRHAGLAAHFNALGAQARREWLERKLGIQPVEALPDRVVAVAIAEPGADPAVVAKGTQLRGSRTSAGTDRIYATDDALTVLGASLRGVRGLRAQTERDHLADWTDFSEPFAPFPTAAPAPHHVDLFTDLIRFSGGQLTVELSFPGGALSALSAVSWQHSTPQGLKPAVSATITGGIVRLILDGECGPMTVDGELRTFLRGALPDGAFPAGALDFSADAVEVRAKRAGAAQAIAPDAAAANDGLVDVSKEFQPFGATPKRGDSFYLQSDEAFGKPLQQLTVTLEMLDAGGNRLEPVNYFAPEERYAGEMRRFRDEVDPGGSVYGEYWGIFEDTEPSPALWWQQRLDGRWETFFNGAPTLGLSNQPGAPPDVTGDDAASELAEVAGIPGRFIRLFLAEGDFGWSQYLEDVANFAAEAATAGGTPDASDLIPPAPPTVSRVQITYTTKKRPVSEIRATNGMARRTLGPGIRPFREPFARTSSPVGVLAIGVDLPAQRRGATLSAFVRVEPTDACPALGTGHRVDWEYWSAEGAWRPLPVVDATSGLRQDGLIRLVAPADWELGCPDTSSAEGRWLRALVAAPGQIGALAAIHLDAVVATRADQAGAPDQAPLAAEALKGPRTRIPGVKKIANPAAGMPGRPPETVERYLARASDAPRHRNRAVQAWDYERLVSAEFDGQVAAVRCLPHRDAAGARAPGFVTLVVVPVSEQLRPAPSVTLAERIVQALRPRMPAHATLVVACPAYVPARVSAEIVLARGVPAAEADQTLRRAIDRDLLHPLASGAGPAFGRPLYRSAVVAFLERRPEVDHVRSLELRDAPGAAPQERIAPPELLGLVASSGEHSLTLEEQL